MKLTISKEAYDLLEPLLSSEAPYLLLWYDTEGCGCGVNGVPIIRLTDQIKSTYQAVNNHYFQIYIEKQQTTFFAEQMSLQVVNNNMLRLSSPEGILNPFIGMQQIQYTK
ncbi:MULTISPECIES: iron-sulfur cluster biosynthesis family protein [Virgibacillus]|uniref:Core domain-containing protein n=1 Tax=Virgibacillus massiliensis TaxID=1462526 RepID=A0A024QBZ5_9BACI|nr:MULTISPECIES: iron-sulfur cluster biosynthesis family protein [Virgibacillus]CDQ39735.1 hypothetical protein BN990_02049 [Virgibacillus massiliensis]